jgi:hypothetical protein
MTKAPPDHPFNVGVRVVDGRKEFVLEFPDLVRKGEWTRLTFNQAEARRIIKEWEPACK